MDANRDYERLQQTMMLISRHPEYPGKSEVVQECLVEIEERQRIGRISIQQREALTAILLPIVDTHRGTIPTRPLSEYDLPGTMPRVETT